MGITVNAPKQDGNARFNSLRVNLSTSSLATRVVVVDDSGSFFYSGSYSGGGGGGTVTTVSIVSANGFSGSVVNPTTTPSITLNTTITGILKGDGTAISAATAGTDYITPTLGTASWSQNSVTASYVTASNVWGPYGSSSVASSSYSVSSSFTQNAITSSYPISVTGSSLYSTSPVTSLINPTNVIALGDFAGRQAVSASAGVFLGFQAGYQAFTASNSNFLGPFSGQGATKANDSNFLGYEAGRSTLAQHANFLGRNAGTRATNALYSNFLGVDSGYQAVSSSRSNFLGQSSGYTTTNANDSNFFGLQTGYQAHWAQYSNFIGQNTGYQATSASYSNFIGRECGYQQDSASYSTLMGYRVGRVVVAGSTLGRNNIIIGTNITLANGTSNGINIGGILFGSGSNTSFETNPVSGSANGKIGINNPFPIETLDISGSLRATASIYFPGMTNSTYPYVVSVDTGSGKLYYTNQFTGSLFGTSSWSQNSITSSNFNGTGSSGFVSNMSDTYTSTAKITDIVTLTSAEYAAIGSPLTTTLYVII